MRFELDPPQAARTGDAFVLTGSAGLSQDAASTINDRLGVDVLREGLELGTVTVNAQQP